MVKIFFLGTSKKTRYDPFKCYIRRDPSSAGFILADNPDAETLDALAEYIAGDGRDKNQKELFQWAKDNLNVRRRDRFVALLRRGEREGRWHSHKGFRGARIYEPVESSAVAAPAEAPELAADVEEKIIEDSEPVQNSDIPKEVEAREEPAEAASPKMDIGELKQRIADFKKMRKAKEGTALVTSAGRDAEER